MEGDEHDEVPVPDAGDDGEDRWADLERRSRLPWLIGAGVVVVIVLAATIGRGFFEDLVDETKKDIEARRGRPPAAAAREVADMCAEVRERVEGVGRLRDPYQHYLGVELAVSVLAEHIADLPDIEGLRATSKAAGLDALVDVREKVVELDDRSRGGTAAEIGPLVTEAQDTYEAALRLLGFTRRGALGSVASGIPDCGAIPAVIVALEPPPR